MGGGAGANGGGGGGGGASGNGGAGAGSGGGGATGSGGSATTGGGGSATTGGGGSTTTGGGGGATGSGGTTTTGTGGSSGTPTCNPNGPQCFNCKDDDGDGFIDAADPECTGPLDNDESSFATGIPGDNSDPCKQDCFFDGNSGQGDDGCIWDFRCDPLSPGANAAHACPYDPNYHNCPTSQSSMCLAVCQRVTPNGCDCFGCCLIPGAPNAIYLSSTCTAKDFADPTKCPPCTQQTSCINTCGHCEICVGKPTLPPDCFPDGGTSSPDGGGDAGIINTNCEGYVYCGPGGVDPANCPANSYCITGCCIPN
jgi:hypothetical protein